MRRPSYIRHLVGRFIQVGRQSGWEVAITRAVASIQSQFNQLKRTRQGRPGCSYRNWILQNELPSEALTLQRELAYIPRITILLPVYQLRCEFLTDTIDSLRTQRYSNWELIVAAVVSCANETSRCLKSILSEDERLRLEVIEPWQTAAAVLNTVMLVSTGEFILNMAQGDRLAPHALFEIVALLNEHPEMDIVYFDEDQCTSHGARRSAPWFKPSVYSPALLLSINYLAHAMIRREIVAELGGYDEQMEGAHEWDLIFRCIERTKRIAHLPQVLYHARRTFKARTTGGKELSISQEAGRRCIKAHLLRKDPQRRPYEVSCCPSGAYRARLPVSGSLVSIIIPTKDKLELISTCVGSILKHTAYPNFEILLVDTGSSQAGVYEFYHRQESDQRIRLIEYSGRFNYSAANNLGASKARGNYLVFLNNDTLITHEDWLDELVSWAEQPGVGVVGAKLIRPDGTIQHAGMILGLGGHGSHVFDGCREPLDGPFGSVDWYRNYLAVTGACMVVPRTVFDVLNGFDPCYQVGYGDIEFCLRAIRAGYQVVYTPFAELVHHEGGTRGLSLPPADVLRASLQFLPVLETGDPNFSPNLSQLGRKPVPACKNEESRLQHVDRILGHYGLVVPIRQGNDILGGLLDRLPEPEWPLYPLSALSPPQRDDRKRLLFVSHDLSQSGAPTILFQVAVDMGHRGYDVTILSPVDGPMKAHYQDAGMDVRVEAGLLDDARLFLEPLAAHDLLLANTILSWRAVHAARAIGKPSIWWIHEAEAGRDQARFDEHIANAFMAAGKVVFPSQYTSDLYSPYAVAENFETVYIGVKRDLDMDSAGPPVMQKGGVFSLLSVGSIEPRKGQDILLKALAILPEDIRGEISCTFIGRALDDGYEIMLSNMVKKYHLKNVRFLGELPSQQLHPYLETCDLFVLPSRSEALPRALLEAMMLGKAVIAASVGGIPEMLDSGGGLTFPAGDSRKLARQIAYLYRDRSAAHSLGGIARTTVETRFTFEAFADRMSALILEAIDPVK